MDPYDKPPLEELMHYGVKGMKWGQKKSSSSSGSSSKSSGGEKVGRFNLSPEREAKRKARVKETGQNLRKEFGKSFVITAGTALAGRAALRKIMTGSFSGASSAASSAGSGAKGQKSKAGQRDFKPLAKVAVGGIVTSAAGLAVVRKVAQKTFSARLGY